MCVIFNIFFLFKPYLYSSSKHGASEVYFWYDITYISLNQLLYVEPLLSGHTINYSQLKSQEYSQ